MEYYKVKVKVGHVGRNHYILKWLYIKSKNGKEAANIARNTPRVKHHQKDAIKEVVKITFEEYSFGIRIVASDPYFIVHSKQEQKLLGALVNVPIYDEDYEPKYKKKRTGQYLKAKSLTDEWKRNREGVYDYNG